MARTASRNGKISTFFSYKGGVGRTMAVANIGFLAAMAGKRVLLMDWDLEAPGLAVYFRGITEHQAAGEIRKAPGVLNLFIDWRNALLKASAPSAVDATFQLFTSGKPFAASACPLLPKERMPAGAKLDIIGAGSAMIGEEEPLPYAEALSSFHWPSFFSDFAGGAMLEALRSWAKRHYDVILVDSRTGLADVAGICTMQLPDEVVLCFVLNRQNTEGVADIAASILAARGEDVAIRLSPMRVAKDRPTEEADARSRATRQMRNAGLRQRNIEEDMSKLAVTAASNVPFFETLAPFAATSATADPLTFEYLRMTQELVDNNLELPRIDHSWVEAVRRRLQPRMTTSDYLASLETADADRGIDEIDRFLDGALDADPSRELDPDYVAALVNAAFESHDWYWDGDNDEKTQALAAKALLLLQQLHEVGDGDWRLQLVNALDDFELNGSGAPLELVANTKIDRDTILAQGPQLAQIVVRRVNLRTQDAAILMRDGRSRGKAERRLNEGEQMLRALAGPLLPEELAAVTNSFSHIAAVRAQIFERAGRPEAAAEQWRHVLELNQHIEAEPASVLVAQAHLGLAELASSTDVAAEEIVRAVSSWRPIVLRSIDKFEWATDMILSADQTDERALAFLNGVVGQSTELGLPVRPMPRTLDTAARFAEQIERLIVATIDIQPKRRRKVLIDCVDAIEQQLTRFVRGPGRDRDDERAMRRLRAAYLSICDTFANVGVPEKAIEDLRDRVEKMRIRIRLDKL